MITIAPKLTDGGMSLLMRCIGGEKITFTRFKIGNGEATGDASALSDLVNPLLDFGIAGINTEESGYLELNGTFSNDAIDSDFRWTELGLFAKGEDDTEMLYAYICDTENASLLKKGGADVMIEQSVSVIVAVGTAQNVTALISASSLYAPKADFDEHVAADNPHGIGAAEVGLDKVPNVSTNDQTPTYTAASAAQELVSGEKLGTAMGKIAGAIRSLIAHIGSKANPHAVTADQAGAAKKEHTHSAADISSGTLGLARGGTGVTSLDALKNLLQLPVDEVKIGFYAGDGRDERSLKVFDTTGRTPRFILIIAQGRNMYENGFRYGGIACIDPSTSQVVETTDSYIRPWPGGFQVDENSSAYIHLNKTGETYGYIAIG